MVGVGSVLAAGLLLAAGAGKAGCRREHGGRMGQALGLTDAQKAKIQPIMEKYRGEMKELRGQTLTPEQKRAKFTELRDKMKAEISPILTQEQRDKAAKMHENRGQRTGGKRGAWGHGRMGRGHAGAMGQRMAKELNLTAAQQEKVKGLVQEHRTAMRSLIGDARSGKVERGQVRERAQALRQKMMAEMDTVLTPEQQQKLKSLREQRGARHKG